MTSHQSPMNCFQTSRQYFLMLALLGGTASMATAVGVVPRSDVPPATARVDFDFQNIMSEAETPASAPVTIYSGSVGPYKAPASPANSPAEIPAGTHGTSNAPIALVEFATGAPVAGNMPYANFVNETITRAQRLLYWRSDNSPEQNNQAAFRYLVKLYGPNTGAGTMGGLSRAAAGGSKEAADSLERLQQMREAADHSLRDLAATEVPTLEEMAASLPEDTDITAEQLEVMAHNREVALRRVEYAQRQLEAIETIDTIRHQGRDATSNIRCNFETIGHYYGDAERARVDEALDILRQAIKYAPLNDKLVNAYLDVFYDRCVAELQFIKIAKVERAQYRLGLIAPSLPFVIDHEIAILRDSVLPGYQAALGGLSEMLSERGGVNVAALSANHPPSTPLGYFLFQREQPRRNKMLPRYVDGAGNFHTVLPLDPLSDEAPVFNGYKDYVMMLGILQSYLTDAADLARLYGMRNLSTGTVNDRATALALIQQVQQETATSVKLLEAMFAGYEPEPGDASGVYAARQGISTALGDFEGVRKFLLGTANALGYDPDFLVLISEFPSSTQGNQFDSYDALMGWITNSSTSVYNFAEATYLAAIDGYDDYRATADELHSQLNNIEVAFSDRYFEIVGTADIDDTEYGISNPKSGSELDQAIRAIAGLEQKAKSLNGMTKNISTAIDESTTYKNDTVPSKTTKTQEILLNYKNSTSGQFDTITHWSATAAGSQAAYDTLSTVLNTLASSSQTPWSGGAGIAAAGAIAAIGAVNTGIQIAAAQNQGEAEKNIDRAQATFTAELALTDIAMEEHGAAQELLALMREQVSNTIDVEGLQAELAQACSRRDALLREVAQIKQKRQENTEGLSDRYFADPIHQLRAQSTQLRADNAFRDAQQWIFFTQRALEYKWNKPFSVVAGGKNYDSGTIFKIRNFSELEELKGAFEQFNNNNLFNFNRESIVDKLSLKYDFFAYRDDVSYAVTNADGTSVTVNADEAFTRRLAQLVNPNTGLLRIPLDTFSLRKNTGAFFLGPQYDNNGQIFSAGKFLDKIEWMKFNIVATGAPSTPVVYDVSYSYGGASYIRTQMPPCYDLTDDRVLAGEFMRFPFRYFRTLNNGASWDQLPTRDDTVTIVVSNTPSEPQGDGYRNTALKERSVAATRQAITIGPDKLGPGKIDITKIKDVEIYVSHAYASREMPDCD